MKTAIFIGADTLKNYDPGTLITIDKGTRFMSMEVKMEIKNAVINSATITSKEHGLLTAYLDLDYGDSCQGFGGYTLYLPASFKHHQDSIHLNAAGHFIFWVMEVAGAADWAKLPGKTLRVRCENGLARAIGHIVREDWFCPSDDFNKFKGGGKDHDRN